jgi:pantetheine-phosphate adenylyltransferase
MTAGGAARLAIYPGSFDPITNGHVDVIRRASRLFDRVVVAVLVNAEKQPFFSTAERVEMIRTAIADDSTIEVETFDGLLVDYAERRGAAAIIRGLRAIADFEYELQMALMNRRLNQRVETVFLMPSEAYIYTSSRLVKEVFMLGGSVQGLVPPVVEARLQARRQQRAEASGKGREN